MDGGNSQLLAKRKAGHEVKRELSRESRSREMEAFFFHHMTCYSVKVIPTLHCGSHERMRATQ